MKTYTLEELRLAQAKGCRIEYASRDWYEIEPSKLEAFYNNNPHRCPFRIYLDDEWKARLPRLKEGARWHRNDFTNEMLEGGFRPLLDGEAWVKGDQIRRGKSWDTAGEYKWDLLNSLTCSETNHCRTTRPVPPEFLHTDELAKKPEAAPQTDTPETNASTWIATDPVSGFQREVAPAKTSRTLERRAIAAESRVKELEADLNEAIEGRKYNSDCINRRAIERDEARADLHKARAALRLRPIAEAGPVPDGMIRLYAHRIPYGPCGGDFWAAFSEPGEEDTHCVDIHPPQQ